MRDARARRRLAELLSSEAKLVSAEEALGNVVTKGDVDGLRRSLEDRVKRLEDRMERVESRLDIMDARLDVIERDVDRVFKVFVAILLAVLISLATTVVLTLVVP